MCEFFGNPACDAAAIQRVEEELGIVFPTSYQSFLLGSNGGEGRDRDNRYLCLWRCQDIPQYNRDYGVHQYLPKRMVAFGTDGANGIFFDCRKPGEPPIVRCALGDLDLSEIRPEAASFAEFMAGWMR